MDVDPLVKGAEWIRMVANEIWTITGYCFA